MLEMLNISQLGNMLFVAPAIVDESSWTEETGQNVHSTLWPQNNFQKREK